MYMIVFILIGTLLLARDISGYDSRYHTSKYFVVSNKKIAKILLPKSVGFQRGVKRSRVDLNKMTYAGAVFQLLNLFVILSIPVFLFLVPKIHVQPFEMDSHYVYIFVDTFNQKLPVLFSLILLTTEVVFELSNVVFQFRKQDKKWPMILSSILILIVALFGLLQVQELISTMIEIFE